MNIFRKDDNEYDNSGPVTNRREDERTSLFQSSYYRIDETEDDVRECWIMDISTGGIKIEVNRTENIDESDELVVIFRIFEAIFREHVAVRHTEGALNRMRCGCQFLTKNDMRSRFIQDYISR
ncbi:MAG: PilZ domain-containing protein [Spirochaetota bacterium]